MIRIEVLLLIGFMMHVVAVLAIDNCDESFPVSKTRYGEVRGTVIKSRNGRPFAAYRGIPYAEPPVGSLRFKAPKEPYKWKGIRNATEDATICIQQDFVFKQNPSIEGNEDCLYISVYSPTALCQYRKSDKALPVIVFIHYGGFIAGSSKIDVIGPEYFMDSDVLLVTFNYRLGIMGFLSTYDDEAPGNWAFKDQVAALKWVKNNIHYFGGNNKKVTIIGQSAGGGSVHHLLLSPSSRGLFQAAISMSGSALAPWAKPLRETHLLITNITALSVGCGSPDTRSMVGCLRNISAADLVNAANGFRTFLKSEPLTPYFAAIEKRTERNREPFITEEPDDIIRKGNFHNVPWIIGVVADEGIIRAAPFIRQEDSLMKINTDFDAIKDFLALRFSVDQNMIDMLWAQIKSFYFDGKNKLDPSDFDSVTGLIDLYSDRAFLYPAYQAMQLHKRMGHKHIFVYNFNYRGKYTFGDLFAATPNDIDYKWGVSHCDDLLYLLHSPGMFPNYELPEIDLKLSEIMLNFFLNFVIYRDPTPVQLWGDKQRWDELPNSNYPLSDEDVQFLDISGSYAKDNLRLNMTNGFYLERMDFWENKQINENRYFNNGTSFK